MVKVISLPYIFQVLYVLCFTRPRYRVSVYRTIGPLVFHVSSNCCMHAHLSHIMRKPVFRIFDRGLKFSDLESRRIVLSM